jgi:hypothetical protein
MPITHGFDADQSRGFLDHAQVAAWDGKEEFLKAPIKQEFSFSGLTEDKIEEVAVIGGNRLAMPSMPTGDLTFNSLNLLTGILAGDFEGEDTSKVRVYYPHTKQKQLVGITVFHMDISEAVILLKKAASVLDIEPDHLKHATAGMLTRFTMFEEKQFQIHGKDIAASLAEKL